MENKVGLCSRCSRPFIIDKRALTLAMPHCAECTKTKDEDVKAIAEALQNIP